MRCSSSDNTSLSAIFERSKTATAGQRMPLFQNVDNLTLEYGTKSGIRGLIVNPLLDLNMIWWNDEWNISKCYSSRVFFKDGSLQLAWSYDKFAEFSANLLLALEGKKTESPDLFFGRVFQKIFDEGNVCSENFQFVEGKFSENFGIKSRNR